MAGHVQAQLSRDLGQLTAEQFDRAMETLVLARDEALERNVDAEDYDLHLAALDGPTQHGLQSYAHACLRHSRYHLWPGLVVGSGGPLLRSAAPTRPCGGAGVSSQGM